MADREALYRTPVVHPDGYEHTGWNRSKDGVDLNRLYRDSDLNAWYDRESQTVNYRA